MTHHLEIPTGLGCVQCCAATGEHAWGSTLGRPRSHLQPHRPLDVWPQGTRLTSLSLRLLAGETGPIFTLLHRIVRIKTVHVECAAQRLPHYKTQQMQLSEFFLLSLCIHTTHTIFTYKMDLLGNNYVIKFSPTTEVLQVWTQGKQDQTASVGAC